MLFSLVPVHSGYIKYIKTTRYETTRVTDCSARPSVKKRTAIYDTAHAWHPAQTDRFSFNIQVFLFGRETGEIFHT